MTATCCRSCVYGSRGHARSYSRVVSETKLIAGFFARGHRAAIHLVQAQLLA